MEKRVAGISQRALNDMVGATLQKRPDSPTRPTAIEGIDPNAASSWPQGEIESTPLVRSDHEPELTIRDDRRYAIDDFTRFHDRAFVIAAYRGVCGRRPDAAGLAHYVELIRNGRSKVEVLGRLRYSSEGRRTASTIAHLPLRYVLAIAQDLPLVGAVIALCELLVRGAATRRSVRRLEAHAASLADLQARQLHDVAMTADRNVRLLDERVDALRRS